MADGRRGKRPVMIVGIREVCRRGGRSVRVAGKSAPSRWPDGKVRDAALALQTMQTFRVRCKRPHVSMLYDQWERIMRSHLLSFASPPVPGALVLGGLPTHRDRRSSVGREPESLSQP